MGRFATIARPMRLTRSHGGTSCHRPSRRARIQTRTHGILVVRHENEISGTTDVAKHPEFAALKTTKFVDGVPLTGWFTENFTLEEIKTLRVRERLPKLRPQNIALKGQQQILTLDEVLDIAEEANRTREVPVGVYVETKHPSYFQGLGIDLNDLLIDNLERRGANHSDSKVIIQLMETGNLRQLRERSPLTLIQLMDRKGAPYDLVAAQDPRTYAKLTSAAELATIAEYADGIGPNKSQVISRDKKASLKTDTGLVGRAHDLGLLVHIWTMRNENNFLHGSNGWRQGADAFPVSLSCHTICITICGMAVINFRTDESAERALAELTADGSTVSDAIRRALTDAVRLRRREQMRRESLEMLNDPDDRAESESVLQEMDQLRAR